MGSNSGVIRPHTCSSRRIGVPSLECKEIQIVGLALPARVHVKDDKTYWHAGTCPHSTLPQLAHESNLLCISLPSTSLIRFICMYCWARRDMNVPRHQKQKIQQGVREYRDHPFKATLSTSCPTCEPGSRWVPYQVLQEFHFTSQLVNQSICLEPYWNWTRDVGNYRLARRGYLS